MMSFKYQYQSKTTEKGNLIRLKSPVAKRPSADGIKWFESVAGTRFPEDFVQFILTVNGGNLDEKDASLFSSRDTLGVEINLFYALYGFDEYRGLYRRLLECTEDSEELPAKHVRLLPIAIDSRGREYCYKLEAIHEGIYLLNNPPLISSGHWDLSFVVISFFELFSSLYLKKNEVCNATQLGDSQWSEIESYLNSGGDINLKTESGRSILEEAIRLGNSDSFLNLLDAGASMDNALVSAVIANRFDMAVELTNRGCNVLEGLNFAVGPLGEPFREFFHSRLNENNKMK